MCIQHCSFKILETTFCQSLLLIHFLCPNSRQIKWGRDRFTETQINLTLCFHEISLIQRHPPESVGPSYTSIFPMKTVTMYNVSCFFKLNNYILPIHQSMNGQFRVELLHLTPEKRPLVSRTIPFLPDSLSGTNRYAKVCLNMKL